MWLSFVQGVLGFLGGGSISSSSPNVLPRAPHCFAGASRRRPQVQPRGVRDGGHGAEGKAAGARIDRPGGVTACVSLSERPVGDRVCRPGLLPAVGGPDGVVF